MPSPVPVQELADRWRPLSAQEAINAARFLDDAWVYLTESELPGLEARIAADEVSIENITRVLCAAVLRVLRNPDGHERESRSIDDYTTSWTLTQVVSMGELFFTDREISSLTARESRGGAWTIRPGGEPAPVLRPPLWRAGW